MQVILLKIWRHYGYCPKVFERYAGLHIFLIIFKSVVPNITGSSGNLGEDHVVDKCFDLIFAFDEVFNSLNLFGTLTYLQRLLLLVATENQLLSNKLEITWKWKVTRRSYTI